MINITRFIKCYGNPVLIALFSVFYIFFPLPEMPVDEYGVYFYVFCILAVWVFTSGVVIALVQPIYGLVKYFTVKENKAIYLHYFYGFAVVALSYAIIIVKYMSLH